ncbi:MAG: acetylxylan esterase [Planctomycetes bacterium]|nr:acetylxylan esterase [Planctomycetota bacterium]
MENSRADTELRRFIHERLPAFVAPTDVKAWKREAARLRKRALAEVYLKGWPASVVKSKPRVAWGSVLRPDPSYIIRKLRFEACPGYWVPALLYEPTKLTTKVPVVFNPNGHHAGGKAADYKQTRCINLAKRGVIAMSPEFVGMGELQADMHHNNQGHLNLVGMAGVGLLYLAMRKGLDVLLAHKHADKTRVGCTGLSGGGWQTIVLASLDERITLAVPVAGYTALATRVECDEDRGDLEQMPPDIATVFDYQLMTAMLAPRPTLQILNDKDDCCFQTARTLPVIHDTVVPTFAAFGAADRFAWHGNSDPGTHNYGRDNREAFYRFINKHWNLDAPDTDIHHAHELQPESALNVGLPPDQQTMLTLALAREHELAKRRKTPRTKAQRAALRKKLAKVLRLPRYDAAAAHTGDTTGGVELLNLTMGPWTVPAAGITQPGVTTTELIIEDHGRGAQRPAEGVTAYWVEPLGMGESAVPTTLVTLLECTGARLLGVQVAQVLAAARWLTAHAGVSRIHLRGNGRTAAMVTLLAAALEPALFHRLSATWETMRLSHLMQWPERYDANPALFCFGLLEVADVPEIRALMEGVEYHTWGRVTPVELPTV